MPPRLTSEIRQAFLDFFASKGHAVIPSASLIPAEDPTVLFTTAGMHPLVPYLLGEAHPAGRRVCNTQPCVRTQDIDEVGDASHLTFFEMLGNWSFGDYFKEGAIGMSYEFLTEALELPKEKLAISCFGGDPRFPGLPRDDESAEIWKKVGIPEERIAFIGGGVAESDRNWWGPAGRTGPCGPDTEMFCWIGSGEPRGNPGTHPGGWLEIWNDVFMEFNKVVEHPSTGLHQGYARQAGSGWARFEPLAKKNVDTGMGLERTAQVMEGVSSVYEIDAMRPILEEVAKKGTVPISRHTRIIVDHLRAATFIVADGVLPSNVDRGYVLRKLIRRAIRSGRSFGIEERFCGDVASEVVAQYAVAYPHLLKARSDIVAALNAEEEQFGKTLKEGLKQFEKVLGRAAGKTVDGQSAFHLYDTYGFPLELTREMAAEWGFAVDEAGFSSAFERHQELSRSGAQQRFAGGLADHSEETTKLHTATHLLNAALRKVLGDHIRQRGSNVTAQRLRFDFTHPEKMTGGQIAAVEKIVNDAIGADLPVAYHTTTVEGAKEEGAIGVFDERYGAEVKVYVIGEGDTVFSREICGGPHVARTGMIGRFRIMKEESSSAGVRRIKATVEGGLEGIEVAGEG